MAEWPCCHDPLRFSFLAHQFVHVWWFFLKPNYNSKTWSTQGAQTNCFNSLRIFLFVYECFKYDGPWSEIRRWHWEVLNSKKKSLDERFNNSLVVPNVFERWIYLPRQRSRKGMMETAGRDDFVFPFAFVSENKKTFEHLLTKKRKWFFFKCEINMGWKIIFFKKRPMFPRALNDWEWRRCCSFEKYVVFIIY